MALTLLYDVFDDLIENSFIEKPTREEVLKLVELYGTGGSPETKSFGSEIYGSIDYEPLCGLRSVRNTEARFEQFGVQFANKTVLDIGCHIGSLCFGAHDQGASGVVGFDTNSDRIKTANAIRALNDLNYHVYFTDKLPDVRADIVTCCSVDEYILDKMAFYKILFDRAVDTLVFESNIQIYTTHPFPIACKENNFYCNWIGEAVDKYPYGANRVRNLFVAKRR